MTNEKETREDAELATWRGEWQALGGEDDFAPQLVARAAKDGRRMRLGAAAEVVAATFSTSFCVWLLVRSHGSAQVVAMSAFILLFNGAWLTHFFTMRAGLFGNHAVGEGALVFVELTRRRLATQRQWMVAARRWTLALGAIVFPWAIWVFLAHKEMYMAEPWRAVVGFGGVVVILGGVYAWTHVKERRLRAEGEAFERHIEEVKLT